MVAELWKSYSKELFHYLNNRIHDDEVARDLVQDTFHKLCAHKDRLSGVENHKAWVFQIARNKLIDYTRKKKERPVDDLLVVDDGDNESSKSVADGIAQCLYELIDEYEGEEREILLKIFTKSWSQKEASKYLDVPYSTLKSRVQKARQNIVEQFKTRCCSLNYNSQGEIIGCTPIQEQTLREC